jgi:undecaprenyl-diphosphatase
VAVLVIAIGVSRLYLGVHYFSDVIAGYAVGVLWLSVCISGLQVAQRRRLTTNSPDPDRTPSEAGTSAIS